ncbi:hypothetical protein Tco_0563087, partial [Tanacetum coccineum]
KYWVVCRTHGIGSAHHPRSNGILVSAPTVAPQGLAILLIDVDTRTETTGDEASPRLIRSKSLPPMYNLVQRLEIQNPLPLGLQPSYAASNY